MSDDPTNPTHYKSLSPEPIQVIEDWDLNFHTGNAVKYIARAGRKGLIIEDLKKAIWSVRSSVCRTSMKTTAESHQQGISA